MHRGVNTGTQTAVAPQLPDKARIDQIGVLRILVGRLQREGVALQPGQKRHIHAQPHVGELGGMDMEIGKGRNDERSAVIPDRNTGLGLCKEAGAAAFPNQQTAVRLFRQVIGPVGMDEIPFDIECLHVSYLASVGESASAFSTRSGVAGISRIRTPVAS
ncbi:hypothetical protein SDC9_209283 [bioreactor metagenome]|uniref:Uncharacterized protein n=1 Tax=bioreactor metagenome TaxID=1076179 RepID=A0A645JCU4_9ZZZZ